MRKNTIAQLWRSPSQLATTVTRYWKLSQRYGTSLTERLAPVKVANLGGAIRLCPYYWPAPTADACLRHRDRAAQGNLLRNCCKLETGSLIASICCGLLFLCYGTTTARRYLAGPTTTKVAAGLPRPACLNSGKQRIAKC